MHQVQLSDQLYDATARRASNAGFRSVDDYISNMLEHDVEAANYLDNLFTPDIIAKLDEAAAQADMGKLITFEELRVRHADKRVAS